MTKKSETPILNSAAIKLLTDLLDESEKTIKQAFPMYGYASVGAHFVAYPKPCLALYARQHKDGCMGPRSIDIDEYITKDFVKGVERFRAKVKAVCEYHDPEIVKGMALKIIEITHDKGECTDRDLRLYDYNQGHISRYADQAADLATEMGNGGPFKVICTPAANAA